MSKVVTANVLATGRVVFLAPDGGWVSAVADAMVYPDAEAAEDGLARAKQDHDRAIVVDPFVASVTPQPGGQPSMTLRDRVRAYGPTIRFAPDAPTSAP